LDWFRLNEKSTLDLNQKSVVELWKRGFCFTKKKYDAFRFMHLCRNSPSKSSSMHTILLQPPKHGHHSVPLLCAMMTLFVLIHSLFSPATEATVA
jgi:hypothetical protein